MEILDSVCLKKENKIKIGLASHQSNSKLPNLEILFFELPNNFLNFN